ncbi:MAG: AAA family ATPase [Desulfomonilaceae bacterium]
MKLLELEVEGYRSLKSVRWAPDDLNVLIGPNGSGKTNLLRVLGILVSCAEGRLSKHIEAEGGMPSISWDRREEPISIEVKTTPPIRKAPMFLRGQENRDCVSYKIVLGAFAIESLFRFSVTSENLRNHYPPGEQFNEQAVTLLERTPISAEIFDATSKTMVDAKQDLPMEEALLSVARPPFHMNSQISEFQRDLASLTVYEDLWKGTYSPSSPWSFLSSIRGPIRPRYETNISPDGANLIAVLHTLCTHDRDFERRISQAIEAAFGSDFDRLIFAPVADNLIQLRMRWKSLKSEISAAEISDGTLRFLLLLAVLLNPEPPSLIAIEEPEIGLHPSMLSIIAELAVDASSRTQVIFTTHSTDFLSAFRDVPPTTTVFNWTDGQTVLETLSEDKLDYWLKDYSLGEMFRSGQLESMG